MMKMNERLFEALDDCIAEINSGSELEECLAKYPGLAEELKPLIKTSIEASCLTATNVPAAARNRSRTMLLAHAAKRRKRRVPLLANFRIPRLALSLAALLVVLVFSFNSLIATSAKTLPGDTLYPIKRAAETVRLQLTNNIEKKHQIEADYTEQRTEEVLELLRLNRTEQISMEGIVQEISPELWVVSGVKIHVAPETRIIGDIQLGQVVEVEGSTDSNSWVSADELHLRYFEISDVIHEMGTDEWTIGELKLFIAPDAQISPVLEIGDQARVLVYSSDNGMLYARAILSVTAISEANFEPFELTFSGFIDFLTPDSVSINGKTIQISDSTIFAKGVSAGSWTHIIVLVSHDGTLTALKLEPLAHEIDTQQLADEEKVDEGNEHNNDVEEMDDQDLEESVDADETEDQNENEVAESDDESNGGEEADDSGDEDDDGSEDADGHGDEDESGDDSGGDDNEDNAVIEEGSEDDDSDIEQDEPVEDDSNDNSTEEEDAESPIDDD